MQKLLLGTTVFFCLCLFTATVVWAQGPQPQPTPSPNPPIPLPGACPPPPEDPWDALGDWFRSVAADKVILMFKSWAIFFWWVEKVTYKVTAFLMQESLWITIKDAVLNTLSSVMPGVLGSIIRGLWPAAIALAGLLMIVPLESRLVKVEQAILWGAVVMAIFVTNVVGYDIISILEEARLGIVNLVYTDGMSGLASLITIPMKANSDEVESLEFALPQDFENEYFPPPLEYEQRAVGIRLGCILGVPLEISHTVSIETSDSVGQRMNGALVGAGIASLTGVPTLVILLFGLTFAALAAGSLIIVAFFIASLPVGFFEFGSSIIRGIVQQYAYLFILTILASFLAAFLSGVSFWAFSGNAGGLEAMLMYIPSLVIVTIAMGKVLWASLGAMMGSFSFVSGVFREAATVAYSAPGAGAGVVEGMTRNLGTAALVGGVALLSGGLGAALAAGAGQLISGTGVGRAAAEVASATGGRTAHVFAQAARGKSALGKASGVVATNIRYRKLESAAGAKTRAAVEATVEKVSARLDPKWGGVDAGGFITTDLTALEAAEKAFFEAGDRAEARVHLERAFGSSEVADEVLRLYSSEGRKGATKVRQVVEAVQATAISMARRGELVFDEKGKATSAYRRRIGALLSSGWLGLKISSPGEAERWGLIAGSVVRKPVGIWSDPMAAHKLAKDTLNPELTEVAAGDEAAQFRLRDVALHHGWGEKELAVLFETVKSAQAASLKSERPVAEEAAKALDNINVFQKLSAQEREEVARLATMVVEGAQVQKAGDTMFDEMAEELLFGVDERWQLLATDVADAIIRNGQGGAAGNRLKETAQRYGWTREDLASVIREALSDSQVEEVRSRVAALAGMGERQAAFVLADARDAAREILQDGGIDGLGRSGA